MPTHETSRYEMPLLQAAQAQKHVTVNEALMRLDGLVNLVLQSVTVSNPPEVVFDAQCWAVPSGATGAWSGQSGRIAIGSNGGWQFVAPAAGMQAFVIDQGLTAMHDGEAWIIGGLSTGMLGSGMNCGLAEAEFAVVPGSGFATPVVIPAGAMVIGAVARVTQAISGTLTGWRLGTQGAENRFGQGLGKSNNSWAQGILGSAMTYYQSEPLRMTAESGTFAGGRVSLAVHWLSLRLPK